MSRTGGEPVSPRFSGRWFTLALAVPSVISLYLLNSKFGKFVIFVADILEH